MNLVCPFRSQAPRGPRRLLPALREELSVLPVQQSHKSKHKTDGNNQKDSEKCFKIQPDSQIRDDGILKHLQVLKVSSWTVFQYIDKILSPRNPWDSVNGFNDSESTSGSKATQPSPIPFPPRCLTQICSRWKSGGSQLSLPPFSARIQRGACSPGAQRTTLHWAKETAKTNQICRY